MRFGTHGIKKRAYLIIISAFLFGVVTGSLLMNLVVAQSSAPKRIPTAIEEISNELQLDPNQRERVEKIFQASRSRSHEIQKTIQPQLDDLRTQTRAEITGLLTPIQQQKYADWLRKKDALRKEKSASPK